MRFCLIMILMIANTIKLHSMNHEQKTTIHRRNSSSTELPRTASMQDWQSSVTEPLIQRSEPPTTPNSPNRPFSIIVIPEPEHSRHNPVPNLEQNHFCCINSSSCPLTAMLLTCACFTGGVFALMIAYPHSS